MLVAIHQVFVAKLAWAQIKNIGTDVADGVIQAFDGLLDAFLRFGIWPFILALILAAWLWINRRFFPRLERYLWGAEGRYLSAWTMGRLAGRAVRRILSRSATILPSARV